MANRFLLLDAARLKQNLDEAKALNPTCISLYNGEMESQLQNAFPFLFSFEENAEFANWYFKNGWGQSWGVILYSEYEMQKTADHLKKHILINTENGKEYFFRFYDPRVLRVFLPTCNAKQLKEFFGPVEQFICEDEDPEFGLVFAFDENNLMTTRINKENIL